jgi:phospholipid-binding lipoprotein MlaA
LLVTIASGLAGCATPPLDSDPDGIAEFEEINDPLEPTNRAIFAFNEDVDTYLLRPAAEGYRAVLPPFGRARVADFLGNLKSPIYLANDVLQGNITLAGETIERFVLNTSFGVFGMMDVAGPLGISAHPSDFGQTFGVWGIGEGPYLVLPLFGPSNPRDAVGLGIESYADPVGYYLQNNGMRWASWTRLGLTAISEREAYLDPLEDIKRVSLDYYSAMRSLYRQRRNAEINQAEDCSQDKVQSIGMNKVPRDIQSKTQ